MTCFNDAIWFEDTVRKHEESIFGIVVIGTIDISTVDQSIRDCRRECQRAGIDDNGPRKNMIFISTMQLTRTLERGEFYCPTCESIQGYRQRSKRTFLTLYFIPVIPISAPEPFIQCDNCKSPWDLSVLHIDQRTHEQVRENQFRNEAIRSCVLMTLEDEEISEAEIQSLLRISGVILENPISREELGRLCSVAMHSGIETHNYVMTVSRRWNMQQRLLALQAMFLAASSCEEDVSDAKIRQLGRLKDLLELTETEFEAVIEDSLMFAGV